MKICILTPRFPLPENGGDVLRINAIARYLKEKGNEIILLSFFDSVISENSMSEAYGLYNKIIPVKRNKAISYFNTLFFYFLKKPMQCGYYYSFEFIKEFRKTIMDEKPDLYISHLLRMTPYLEKESLYDKSIIEMTDALSKTYSLSKGIKRKNLKSIIYKLEKTNIEKYENKVIEKFNKVILVSENDINFLHNKKHLFCYTNGISIPKSIETTYKNNKICFVGNMRTLQNQDAVLYFIEKIFPKLKEKFPTIQFHIVGAQPPKSIIKYRDNHSVFVTGFVDSVDEYIKDSCLLVAPIRIAAGIQNKVLVGLANGVPVILSSVISQAIPELVSGENCFIADNDDDIVNACSQLISNPNLRGKLSLAGYSIVKENYSWNVKLEGYEKLDMGE